MVNRMLDNRDTALWRMRAMKGLAGTLVEPGFGSGLNVPLYPEEVKHVYAVDPAKTGAKLAAERVAASPVEIEFVGLDGQSLPLDNNCADAGLLTFTLCTIPDPALALSELRRVIAPGGRLHFVEHGRADEESVLRWQQRLEPIQRRVGDGCHLTRDAAELIADAGFEIEWVDKSYAKGPKPFVWFSVGQAVNP
ncbi:MAG: class I SAM-dependent methyltransferase [Acidobacteria bacterium]|nr:class I SAM-dependent methyltransferase [Acidobacteriota bacterium]